MLLPVEQTKRSISDVTPGHLQCAPLQGAVEVTFGNEHTSTTTNRERRLEPVVASLTEHVETLEKERLEPVVASLPRSFPKEDKACHDEEGRDDDDQSFSRLSKRKALTCREGQSARALAPRRNVRLIQKEYTMTLITGSVASRYAKL